VSFSAKELIRVLKACRENGVAELKVGEIVVKFGHETPDQITATTGHENPVGFDDELKKAAERANVDENLSEAEGSLELMQISDPATYERLIIERELEEIGKPGEISEH